MKTKEITARSPKNKFVAQVCFNNALPEVGSVSSIGAMTLEDVKANVHSFCGDNIKAASGATVIVRENKKEYPLFEWVEVETYKL